MERLNILFKEVNGGFALVSASTQADYYFKKIPYKVLLSNSNQIENKNVLMKELHALVPRIDTAS